MKIGSPQNPKVKYVIKLRKHGFRSKQTEMLIEGLNEVMMAFNNLIKIETIFFCSELFTPESYDLLNKLQSESPRLLFEVTEDIFQKISYRENPDGWLAIAKISSKKLTDIKLSKSPLIIIAESVEKPGNLGTILRSADATGADAVILTDPTTDIYNPNVIRASIGAIFSVPTIETSNEEVLKWLRMNNFQVLGAICDAKLEYTKIDMNKPTALIVGTEKTGLSDFWLKNCDFPIIIPMLGQVNSLNVATATAIILYEVVRQRQINDL